MKKKLKIALSFFVAILGSMFIFTGFSIINIEKGIDYNSNIESAINEMETESLNDKYNSYRKTYNNNDVVGTLSIPNLFATLLVKTNNNSYYLNHSITKEETKLGAVFIDHRSNIDTGKQINIYGHNSQTNDIPFRKLENYLNMDYFISNKNIILETEKSIYTYEIVFVKITSSNDHMKVLFNSDNEYINHINTLRNNTLFDNNNQIEKNDRILLLQTCLFDNPNGDYLLVVAKEKK